MGHNNMTGAKAMSAWGYVKRGAAIVSLVAAAWATGAAGADAPEVEDSGVSRDAVNVVLYYNTEGETGVELWDQDGNEVPLGSVAEDWTGMGEGE